MQFEQGYAYFAGTQEKGFKMIHLKTIGKKSFLAVILCLSVFLMRPGDAVSSNEQTFQLPLPGEFKPAVEANGSAKFVRAEIIDNMFRKHSRSYAGLHRNEEIKHYIVPQHGWLKELTNAYVALIRQSNLEGKADTWDCENYSELLSGLSTVRIWEAGYYDTRGAIGWFRVDAQKAWAGIPPEMHALMFAFTENGLFIMEPQNGQSILLEDYPNKQYIQEVFLF